MEKKRILFLCTGNSARSQMGEGFLRHLAGERFEPASAGIHPVGLHPLAVEVMKEVGIDISKHRSKSIDEFVALDIDHVITVCDPAKEACPMFPGETSVLHWSFDDPAAAQGDQEERLAVFRRVRDEIAGQVRKFVQEKGETP